MLKRPFAFAAAGLLALTAGACASDADADNADNGSSTTPTLDVVAAFYPLEFLASQVGGEHVAVTGLAPPGVDAHDLELTPSQVGEVAEADLVVYLTDFQPAVDAAITEHADQALDVTTVVPLLSETDDDDDHADEDHGHDAEDDHGHGDQDPHLWLDPQRMITIADELAAEFGELDADHAQEYAANADTLTTELEQLDADYTEGLADCERREIVVSHAAFGYLADRYDLRQIAITGLSPEDEPTPQRLNEVIQQAQSVGATTIFFEVLVSPDVAEVIANEVGAETAVLDPIEGLAPDSDEDYLSLMRQNLDNLRAALGCS